jgi:hypothetical protein
LLSARAASRPSQLRFQHLSIGQRFQHLSFLTAVVEEEAAAEVVEAAEHHRVDAGKAARVREVKVDRAMLRPIRCRVHMARS